MHGTLRRGLVPAASAGAAWLVFYAAWLVLRPGGQRGATIFVDTAYLVPIGLATALALLAARRGRAGLRGFWRLLALSNALWLGAELLWSVRELGRGDVPFPWWTDAGYLASYALVPLAIYAAFRPTLRTVQPGTLLDGLLVVGSLALVWWAVVLEPLTLSLDLVSLTGLSYPAFGLLLIGMLTATRLLPSRHGARGLRLVGAGIVCSAVADGLYTHAVVTHSYLPGDWIGLGWQAEAVLFSLGAYVAARGYDDEPRWMRMRDPVPVTALIAVGTLASVVGVPIYAMLAGIRTPALALATAGLGLVLAARIAVAARRTMRLRSLFDPHTGSFDRRYFDVELRRLGVRSRHFGEPFAIALVEPDGDAPIISGEVARRVVHAVREVDTVARLEPHRLAILVPNVDEDDVRRLAERVRVAVAAEEAATVSVGVGTALESAELALETAQELGGNQIRTRAGSSFDALLDLVEAVDVRESGDPEYSRRVATLARDIAVEMRLDCDVVSRTYLVALLRDIGKVSLPESLLLRWTSLSVAEKRAVQTHPALGRRLVGRFDALADVSAAVGAHHERWDGGGYPRGLAGQKIPVEARVVAVADAFVEMVRPRLDREPLTLTKAMTEIWRSANDRYDPSVVSALLALGREGRLVVEERSKPARVTLSF